MYSKSFYITKKNWNNAFSYEKRKNKQLFVPELIGISNFEEIKIWDKIAFEDFDFDWKLSSNVWLKKFYKLQNEELKDFWVKAPIYIFDNHNHAYYFWYLSREEWIIGDNNILYHIDEHADTRDSWEYLLKPESYDLKKVFDFTNYVLNVWNYIVPALKEWIISEVVQIRNEMNLNGYLSQFNVLSKEEVIWNIILNLDIDFFQPELDYIDFELKKKVILDIAKKAKLITISTSPFFINQELAIKRLREVFS